MKYINKNNTNPCFNNILNKILTILIKKIIKFKL